MSEDKIFCKGGGCTAKLGPEVLDRILPLLPRKQDKDLLVGYDHADDAAIYRLTEDLAIVQTLDFFPPMVEDPHVFGQIAAAMECREVPPPPSLHERFRVLRRHIYDMCEDKGEYIAMQQARTHAAWYMHGLRGAATLRRECCGMLHFTDLDRVIEHAWELQRETR